MTDDKILETLVRIEQILYLLVLPQIPAIIERIMEVFGDSTQRAKVYLAIDGESTGTKIAQTLGIFQSEVAEHIGILAEAGLLIHIKKVGRGYIYGRNPAFEMIGLLERIRSKFNL